MVAALVKQKDEKFGMKEVVLVVNKEFIPHKARILGGFHREHVFLAISYKALLRIG
ncbi:MAG: hypothetical protein QG646_3074 [Euryarchaeota archaeon]|nr:hypothetical protein [Euryarchaeota archaeon]